MFFLIVNSMKEKVTFAAAIYSENKVGHTTSLENGLSKVKAKVFISLSLYIYIYKVQVTTRRSELKHL